MSHLRFICTEPEGVVISIQYCTSGRDTTNDGATHHHFKYSLMKPQTTQCNVGSFEGWLSQLLTNHSACMKYTLNALYGIYSAANCFDVWRLHHDIYTYNYTHPGMT